MKTWNTPEIKELNISATMMHGKNQIWVDGFIYDADRDTNWTSYSGSTPDSTAQQAEVNIPPVHPQP
jgi:hypothetical protein